MKKYFLAYLNCIKMFRDVFLMIKNCKPVERRIILHWNCHHSQYMKGEKFGCDVVWLSKHTYSFSNFCLSVCSEIYKFINFVIFIVRLKRFQGFTISWIYYTTTRIGCRHMVIYGIHSPSTCHLRLTWHIGFITESK